MKFSISFLLSKMVIILLASIICLSGYAGAKAAGESFQIAVLPAENLSGTPAPLKDIRKSLMKRLKIDEVNLVDEEVLEKFIARNRMRYTGGIDKFTAQEIKEETGTDAVLITSLELYYDKYPPRIALNCRLVSTVENPEILWMDSVGLAGDDSPGLLDLGLIKDPQQLTEKAIGRLYDSLVKYLSTRKPYVEKLPRRFKPKYYYRSSIIDPSGKYTVAVIPFFNLSDRKNAGEIVALHFVRSLKQLKNLSVIEPGIVRQQLLRFRIIMDDGISLAQSDLIFKYTEADLILTGRVMDYQDYRGPMGRPKVDFSVMLIERNNREVVWASKSSNEGDEGVIVFDFKKIRTAHIMASEMAGNTVEMMLK